MLTSSDGELERLRRELHTLTEIAKTLTAPLDITALLQVVMDTLVNVLEPAEIGVIMLWDQSVGLFRPAATFGWDLEALRDMGLRAGEGITGKVYDDEIARLAVTPEDVVKATADLRPANRAVIARALSTEALPRGILAVPLRASDNRFGALVIATLNSPMAFTEADLPFVQTLADLIALAIDRACLESEAPLSVMPSKLSALL
jgi:GAF domain-containing protein